MSDDPTHDRITEVLAAHRGAMQIKDVQDLRAACYGCEWVGLWRQSTLPANDDHDAHVAALLADLMGDELADAWDEGFMFHGRKSGNPHRRVTDDGEDA